MGRFNGKDGNEDKEMINFIYSKSLFGEIYKLILLIYRKKKTYLID